MLAGVENNCTGIFCLLYHNASQFVVLSNKLRDERIYWLCVQVGRGGQLLYNTVIEDGDPI